jgi:hypothetical protein
MKWQMAALKSIKYGVIAMKQRNGNNGKRLSQQQNSVAIAAISGKSKR